MILYYYFCLWYAICFIFCCSDALMDIFVGMILFNNITYLIIFTGQTDE